MYRNSGRIIPEKKSKKSEDESAEKKKRIDFDFSSYCPPETENDPLHHAILRIIQQYGTAATGMSVWRPLEAGYSIQQDDMLQVQVQQMLQLPLGRHDRRLGYNRNRFTRGVTHLYLVVCILVVAGLLIDALVHQVQQSLVVAAHLQVGHAMP